MREIKFRGKSINTDEWIYGNLIHTISHHDNGMPEMYFKQWEEEIYFIQPIMTIGDEMAELIEVIPETVGQYTGLKDKNGKEIYEGDIILYEDWEMAYEGGGNDSFINKGIIEYVESNCCFNATERQTVDLADVLYEGNEDLEVIGNIHDNPELIK